MLLLILCATVVSGTTQFGYIPNGNDTTSQFFFALYPSANASAPLVLWLQGGPGGSSLFGDFLENGPVNVFQQPRSTSWTQLASVLYVDNPIGTGFSYTTSNAFATTDAQIGAGLVSFFQGFFARFPRYRTTPLYLFTESYGGKMTAIFGMMLQQAIEAKEMTCNFKGVALGDGWLAPVDCMASYGPYLQALSLIDSEQAAEVKTYADKAAAAIAQNNGALATDLWGQQQNYISAACGGCNWYNAINSTDLDAQEAQLNVICSPGGFFYEQFKQIVPAGVAFGSQAGTVFTQLSDAFMRDGVYAVEFLLKRPQIQVNVYSGQLDIIVDALCTEQWIGNMTWTGLSNYKKQSPQPIVINGIPEGFVRSYQNFAFYRIFRAGHMVPNDNPQAAYWMLKHIINP